MAAVAAIAPSVSTRPKLMTVKDVAVELDVHVMTVRRLIREQKLDAVRIGRLVKVRRSSLVEYLERNMYSR